MELEPRRRTARFAVALTLAMAVALPAMAQICDEPPPPEPVKPTTSISTDDISKPQA